MGDTKQTEVGRDEKGCPKYECKPIAIACATVKCPPLAKIKITGKDKNGCPIVTCSVVSPCPPMLLGCGPGTKQVPIGKDEKGCPKFECKPIKIPCAMVKCPPLAKIEITGKDKNG